MKLIKDLQNDLRNLANPEKALLLRRFFKMGKGEYAFADEFLGVMVPDQRKLAKKYHNLNFAALDKLLSSKLHEERLVALLILVLQNKNATPMQEKAIFDFYLAHTSLINNWDLVDLSASHIVGKYLFAKDKNLLFHLVEAKNLWERRIAMVSTHYFIRNHYFTVTLQIAEKLLKDDQDLIHKATGWMLREVGKRDLAQLEEFLSQYHHIMPRTMLRYAIEKFPESRRREFLIRK